MDIVLKNMEPDISLTGWEPHLHPSEAPRHVLDLSEHQLHDLQKKNKSLMNHNHITTPTSKGFVKINQAAHGEHAAQCLAHSRLAVPVSCSGTISAMFLPKS